MKGLRISKSCFVGANVIIGDNVIVGERVKIMANVVLQNCEIGDDTIIHPGTCVGQDGFGFLPSNDVKSPPIEKPQLKNVVIGKNVRIGALCTIDRGSHRNTIISDGCKLDNQIQIGHNVQIGPNCLICAQVGIAGSVTIGTGVLIGGQAGIHQYVKIGDYARIAAKSGVMRDVAAKTAVGGLPAVLINDFHRQTIFLQNVIRKNKEKK